ncbi:MAG: hypothetical protein D4S02_04950 [Rhodocyclaceae bacterium]|nr:MAG: hypothetical protein D4S02_04950 [Rhodocyclaceae bacterium]
MLSEIIFGLIAMTVAIIFYLIPVVKLAPTLGMRVIPLVVVVLVGVVMMIVEFVQTVRASKDDGKK